MMHLIYFSLSLNSLSCTWSFSHVIQKHSQESPEGKKGCRRGCGGQNLPRMKAPLLCENLPHPGLEVQAFFPKGHSRGLGIGTGHHTVSPLMFRVNSVTQKPWQMGYVLLSSSNQVAASPHGTVLGRILRSVLISEKKKNPDQFVTCIDFPCPTKMCFLKSRRLL